MEHMRAQPRPTAVRTGVSAIWWADVAFGLFAVIWTAEATVRLPAPGALTAIAYGYFCLRFLMAPDLLRGALHAWPVFLFPLICLTSVMWSFDPQASLIGGVQLIFTILLGIFLGRRFGLTGLAGLVMTGLGLTMLASVANIGGILQPSHSWEGGFLGIYTNKNALGQRGAVLVLALLLFFICQPRARAIWGGMLVATGLLLGLSLSVTAIVLACLGGGAFIIWQIWPRSASLRTVIAIATVTSASLGLVLVLMLQIDPVAEFFGAFGKNHTLTGRTFLWQIAVEKIREYPILGMGYLAYWSAPEFAQETRLIAALYGSTVSAFHNVVFETLTATGPLGLVGLGALVVWSIRQQLRAAPGPLARWAILTTGLLVAFALLGSSLYRPHEISLLLIVALGAAAQHRPFEAGATTASRSSQRMPSPE